MIENHMVIGPYYPEPERAETDPDEAYDRSRQEELDDEVMRRRAEEKLNRELQQLRNEMNRSRCSECGFTGYEHQEWCPKRDR